MEYANAWLASRPADGTNYAVWGSWDDPALGAISTLKQMGRTDVRYMDKTVMLMLYRRFLTEQ